jgi:hypothetical protein
MKIGVELRPGRIGGWSRPMSNEKKEKRKKRNFKVHLNYVSMAGLRINDQKNAIAVTMIIVTAFKIGISHRKNGLLNRLPTKVSFSVFD